MPNRFGKMFGALPVVHQVVIGIAVAVLAMAAFLFFRWVSTPSYTLLYSNLDDQTLGTVVDELERLDIPYEIEGGGSRLLVPRSEVYRVRADLASSGVRSGATAQGYELLDSQGLNVSDFRQRIDFQRALEGELSRTLVAMSEVTAATVHLVLPKESLFAEDEEPATASVLIDTSRRMTEVEIETITFLVASSVEGLRAEDVTVADVDGQVLHAAGQLSAGAAMSSRNLRMTRDYESALATDVKNLLTSVMGPNSASVVVRAKLDFDETSTESETFVPDSAVALKEQAIDESFAGAGAPPGGTLGVDGAEVEPAADGDYTYGRTETIREFGVDRVVTKRVTAPGRVDQLSVAVVVDDGSLTGATALPTGEVESLVGAAIGLDAARGDKVVVTAVAFPVAEEVELVDEAAAASSPLDLIPQAVGGIVLLIVVVSLMMMARGSKSELGDVALDALVPSALPQGGRADVGPDDLPSSQGQPVAVGAASGSIQPEVINLVQRQPEEIAVLLRGWLADRR